jgi:hypothetical protein
VAPALLFQRKNSRHRAPFCGRKTVHPVLRQSAMVTLFVWSILASGKLSAQVIQLEGYFKQVRGGVYGVVPKELRNPALADEHLNQLAKFLSDSVSHVRQQAIELVQVIGRSATQAPRVRAVEFLAQATADADAGNAGNAIAALTTFNKADFTDLSRQHLYTRFRGNPPQRSKLIRLMGFVNVPAANDELRALAIDVRANRNDRWAALLALSRVGDESATNDVMSRAKRLPVSDDVVYEIFPDLLYTRSPEAIGYLISVLQSDSFTCESANPERSVPIPCAYRVMEMLASVIEGFPVQLNAAGDVLTTDYRASLQRVRAWLSNNPDFKILVNEY